jgi:hypothetical protein
VLPTIYKIRNFGTNSEWEQALEPDVSMWKKENAKFHVTIINQLSSDCILLNDQVDHYNCYENVKDLLSSALPVIGVLRPATDNTKNNLSIVSQIFLDFFFFWLIF